MQMTIVLVLAAVWNLGEVSVDLPAKPRATQKQAAAELAHHLELITGDRGSGVSPLGTRKGDSPSKRRDAASPRFVLGRVPDGFHDVFSPRYDLGKFRGGGNGLLFGIVPTFADDIEKFIGEWAKAGLRRFFLRPNFHCAYTVLPRGVEKRIYDVYRYCCAHGLEGVDFDADFNRYPLRPENYVTCRMIADPEGSFEDFMRDYCAAFGEAAPEIAEYCARIRARAGPLRGLHARPGRHSRHTLPVGRPLLETQGISTT